MMRVTNTYEQRQVIGWLKPAIIGLVVVSLAASVYAHFRLAGSETYVGLLAPLDRVFDLALVAALLFLLVSLGVRIARLLRLSFSGAAETLSISLFLGTGVYGLAVLGLGLLGRLRPVPVLLTSLLSLILCRHELRVVYDLIRESFTRAVSTQEGKLVISLFACFLLLLLLRAATPPYVFDENIYHLPVTRQFVDHGRVFPLFNNSMGNQPFLIHMIYAVCLLAGSDIAAKFFSLALALATALALYAFCQRFITRRVGVIAAFVFFAAGMVTEVAVTTRVDVVVAGMLFVTAYALINYLETGQRGWLWTSALLAGFSLGVKHSAALWLLLLGGMYLIESLRQRRKSFGATVLNGLAYMAIALAVASPWYIKNYVWFGNPFYPFFTGEVVSDGPNGLRYFNSEDELKLDSHFDLVRREDPELVKAEQQVLARNASARPTRHPMLPWEVYLKPSKYLMAEARHYPNFLFLVLPLSLLVVRRRWLVWLLVLSVCYFLMATWSSWIARYLLPAYPALTIITAYTLVAASDWLKRKAPTFEKLPLLLVGIALMAVVAACVRSLKETNSLAFVAGTISRQDFMRGFTYYPPLIFINTELPVAARIMTVGAQMTYGLQREYLADETWYTTKWRRLLVRNSSLNEVNEDLKRQGVNYVLFSPDLYLFAAANGLENGQMVPPGPRPLAARALGIDFKSDNDLKRSFPEAQQLGTDFPVLRNWATFTLYRKKFLEPVYSDENGYRIYRIR